MSRSAGHGQGGQLKAIAQRAAREVVVARELRNAAENGYSFEGWPNLAVTQDLTLCCAAVESWSEADLAAAVVAVRGPDVECSSCQNGGRPGLPGGGCENCMGYGFTHP